MPDAAGGRTPEDVRRVLAERISAGHLRPGQRLGAERALAADLGVSRATLRQALAVLADSGVVRRVPGRGGGTFVSQDKIERDTSRVVGVPALLRSQGVVAGTRVISAEAQGAWKARLNERLLWGAVLYDGFAAAAWRIERQGKKSARLEVRPLSRLTKKATASIITEGNRLLAFAVPDAPSTSVEVLPY